MNFLSMSHLSTWWKDQLANFCSLVSARQLLRAKCWNQSSTIANSAKKKNAVISKFIRLAHFKRFPKGDNSKLTDQVMLAALERPICPSDTQDLADKPQKIRFELDIIKAGHHAEYKKSDVIIDPILNNLRTWANRWSPSTFRAPYTFIVGPTMIGETRVLMQLAKHICVIDILSPPLSRLFGTTPFLGAC
jgi:hypothetical protein